MKPSEESWKKAREIVRHNVELGLNNQTGGSIAGNFITDIAQALDEAKQLGREITLKGIVDRAKKASAVCDSCGEKKK